MACAPTGAIVVGPLNVRMMVVIAVYLLNVHLMGVMVLLLGLRQLAWKRWKRGETRYQELVARGGPATERC